MKQILVPTDFSAQADNAFKIAVRIAERTKASIKLLHIIEVPYSGSFGSSGSQGDLSGEENFFVMKMIETAKKRLQKTTSDAAYLNVNIVPVIKVGGVFKHITDYISEEKIDLIVMGTKGDSGIHEFLIGSNTEKVVKLATCPVLTVKEMEEDFRLDDILFATDFVTVSPTMITMLNQLKAVFKSKIHLLYVNTPSGFCSREQSQKAIEQFNLQHDLDFDYFEIYNAYTEVEGIKAYAKEVKADVIVMVTHGRAGIARFMSGSVCDDVIHSVTLPVLTAKFKPNEV